jgi:dehydrogenase/reductase SDR family protein 12
MYTQTLQADDLENRAGAFDGVKAYAQMKRAQVLLAEHWAEEWRSDGVSVHAMHPGWAATPGVARSLPGFNRVMERYLRDSRMGADTVVWLGSSPEVAAHSGKFWFDRKPRPTQLSVLGSAHLGKSELLQQLRSMNCFEVRGDQLSSLDR